MQHQIGIFDSGVGGLSVLEEIKNLLPQESIIYVGDWAHAPYGNKTDEQIYALSKGIISFLRTKQVKLIVIACNTASTTSLERLRRDFPDIPLVGTVPVVKTAARVTHNKKIGILSTVGTAKSKYQQRLIEQFAKGSEVITVGTDELVPFVERGELNGAVLEATLVGVLAPLIRKNVDVIALGCTHFPFLRDSIQRVLGSDVQILDSGAAIGRQVKRILETRNELRTEEHPHYTFYTTGDKDVFEKRIHQLLPKLLDSKIQEVSSIEL